MSCTRTNAASYWTPSRCAKILIAKDVHGLPADLFIYVKGAGFKWWVVAWWCAATPPPATAAAPPAGTTTSPCTCRPPCALRNPPAPLPAPSHSFHPPPNRLAVRSPPVPRSPTPEYSVARGER